MTTVILLGYMLLYVAAVMMVPDRKLCKGLFTKHIFRRVFSYKMIWKEAPRNQNTWRYLILCGLWWALQTLLHWPGNIAAYGWYIFYVALLLDDYFFGDDKENKRRWEWVKNKVKWEWTPDMEPAKVRIK